MRPAGGWEGRALMITVVFAVAACGADSPLLSTADPLHDLITIDQLVAPGFTVTTPPGHIDATALGTAAGDASIASALRGDGLQSAASVEYQRAVDFGTSNGPIDIVATVARFAAVNGASSAYSATIGRIDAIQGAVQTSTGPLGDQAHSISVVRAAPDGLQAVEITVVWRVSNLVNIIVARGRYGGTRLEDALVLAGLQTQNEWVSASD
jgi:hypothetical protein